MGFLRNEFKSVLKRLLTHLIVKQPDLRHRFTIGWDILFFMFYLNSFLFVIFHFYERIIVRIS